MQTNPEQKFQSISVALIRSIFIWASLLGLIFSALQIAIVYSHVNEDIERELIFIGASNTPLMSISLYDIEPKSLQNQVQAIVSSTNHVGFVRLRTPLGKEFIAGNPQLANHVTPRTFAVHAPAGLAANTLGTLELYEDPKAVLSDLISFVAGSVIGYVVLTLAICLVVALVLSRKLEKPLAKITRFVSELKPENITQQLNMGTKSSDQINEIDRIVKGFEVMQAEICTYIFQLDRIVEDRTQELESALKSLHTISRTDSLTHCYNRRAFDEKILTEIERAKRYGIALSFIFGDIDYFKNINDTLGHSVGDQVLATVARYLHNGSREGVDWLVRFGGEEFLMVLPETNLSNAFRSAERLRKSIEKSVLLPQHPDLHITISFGVATYINGESVTSLINRADAALYQAKQNGRNKSCMVQEAPDSSAAHLVHQTRS